MCGDEGEEREGRDNQGRRGPGRICSLVDLKEQSEHTSMLLEEHRNQGEIDDVERITGSPRS